MYSYMTCHMVFDMKMSFTRKSQYVDTGCHATKSDDSLYAGVVSCEIFCIDFTYATLNGVDIMSDDIQNTYLTSPSSEKYWTRCGPKFGSEHE